MNLFKLGKTSFNQDDWKMPGVLPRVEYQIWNYIQIWKWLCKFNEQIILISLQNMQEKVTLMDLFNRPHTNPITPQKVAKKPKPNQNNNLQDDPLYKILSWRDPLKTQQIPSPEQFKLRTVNSIVQDNQQQWGSNFQGILINADWDTLSFQQFKRLQLGDTLISNGIVFVWGASHNVAQLFDYFAEQGLLYVENFMFVMLDRNKIPAQKKNHNTKNSLLNYFKKTATKEQQDLKQAEKQIKDYQMERVNFVQEIFMERDGQYFKQSQRVLYMFRKPHKTEALELRHQRTSDAFFTIGNDWSLDWRSMQAVYKMIETLLIKANYQKNKPFRLLQLWGSNQRTRKGWVTVSQEKKSISNMIE